MSPFAAFLAVVFALVFYTVWRRARWRAGLNSSAATPCPRVSLRAPEEAPPRTDAKDCQLVSQALRQFFSGLPERRPPFPSPCRPQLADDLCTSSSFTPRTTTPSAARPLAASSTIRRRWCSVRPGKATKACAAAGGTPVPRREYRPGPADPPAAAFRPDAKFKIADGFFYVPDCGTVKNRDTGGAVYCGGDCKQQLRRRHGRFRDAGGRGTMAAPGEVRRRLR